MKLTELYERHEAVRSALIAAKRRGASRDVVERLQREDRSLLDRIRDANIRRRN